MNKVSLYVAGMLIVPLAFFMQVSAAHAKNPTGEATVFTKHFSETLFSVGGKGQVSIEVLLDEKEYKIGKDVIGIVVHDSHDEDVEDAELLVTATGLAEPLKVKEKGGGLYLVPAAVLPKDGKWELRIAVKKRKIDDGTIFVFPNVMKERLAPGKYDTEMQKGRKEAP